jgi:pimeloyl-ACP methyl ester carboxylesterase
MFFLVLLPPAISAQDLNNDDGRYRPQGRQIAAQIGRQLEERLFEARAYDPMFQATEFAAATIFYPLTLSFDAPVSSVVLVPGYRGTQAAYDWWGPTLASLGIATMIIDTNSPEANFEERKNALVAAVALLRAENTREGSPLLNKLNADRIGIMGHSLGGGASLAAAVELGDQIHAVIPLTPYCCELRQSFTGDYGNLTVPTLIFGSAEDTVAPPATHSKLLYDAIAPATPRAYLEFTTGAHNLPTNEGTDLQTLAYYTVAWLKLHLEGKTNLAEVFAAPPEGEEGAKFAEFLSAN